MPAGDGTGPMGMGPMSGRAAGYCAGYGMPGYANPRPGFGMGFGGRGGRLGGFGRGWRHRFFMTGLPRWGRGAYVQPPYGAAPLSDPDTERQWLEGQASMLQGQLEDIRKRLDDMAAAAKDTEA